MNADAWTLGEKAITAVLRQLDAERALADDLADVLDRLHSVIRQDITDLEDTEISRVLARYRETRQR